MTEWELWNDGVWGLYTGTPTRPYSITQTEEFKKWVVRI